MKNQKSSKENEPATNLRISLLAAKYIVPPGLHTDFFDFLNLCKIAKDNPIMIVGDTGVGKSMFLHVINKLFEQEHGGDTKKHPVCWVNCAHFEPNLARFELFGHVKGSFSGAIKTTDGSVKIADNGLLILEEIGELPLEVQAILLTFIETGQYKRIGNPTEQHANVRIMGATNMENALRNDFRYRFLPFYVPSLYERREDALY
jgi:two-component system NtrC family response regulator